MHDNQQFMLFPKKCHLNNSSGVWPAMRYICDYASARGKSNILTGMHVSRLEETLALERKCLRFGMICERLFVPWVLALGGDNSGGTYLSREFYT